MMKNMSKVLDTSEFMLLLSAVTSSENMFDWQLYKPIPWQYVHHVWHMIWYAFGSWTVPSLLFVQIILLVSSDQRIWFQKMEVVSLFFQTKSYLVFLFFTVYKWFAPGDLVRFCEQVFLHQGQDLWKQNSLISFWILKSSDKIQC